MRLLLLFTLSACSSWEAQDLDGDGWTAVRGDCWDTPGGSGGLSGADIHPEQEEVWYDGVDQNCDGQDDFDQDGDGQAALAHGGTDCDDTDASRAFDPAIVEIWYNGFDENCDGNDGDRDGDGYYVAEYEALSGQPVPDRFLPGDCQDSDPSRPLPAINGFDDVSPADIHPDAIEAWYDGIDADCAGDDDFDQDGDGFATDTLLDPEGQLGDDCDDEDLRIHPGAEEVWYDGIDADCAGDDDYDQDHDGHATTDATPDCDDDNAATHPGATETCATRFDDDCDGDANDLGAEGCTTHFPDLDGDSYGATGIALCLCDARDYTETFGTLLTLDDTDCDDSEANAHPGAEEGCDALDNDCDGMVDEGFAATWLDADGDGFGDPDRPMGCVSGPGLVYNDADCDDTDASVKPGATELTGDATDQNCDGQELCYIDDDTDGYAIPFAVATTSIACDAPGLALASVPRTDCDDDDDTIHPTATELPGDAIDQDCDGRETCYTDADSDGSAVATLMASADTDCNDAGEGTATESLSVDCNDSAAAIHPGAEEGIGDGVDQDCDDQEFCYTDADNDGSAIAVTALSRDTDCNDTGEGTDAELSSGIDCNDTNATIRPGATEVVGDNIDSDCDSRELCYIDADSDGYAVTSGATILSADADCMDVGETLAATPRTDCNDTNSLINPGMLESVGDSVDQNCDGSETCYTDADNDGSALSPTLISTDTDCADASEGTAAELASPNGPDCNDTNAAIKPTATEVVGDSVDQNCDGRETCYADVDDDGYTPTSRATITSLDTDCTDASEGTATDPGGDCNDTNNSVRPGATEITGDSVDQNCDGVETCYTDADNDGSAISTARTSTDADCDDASEGTAAEFTSPNGPDCNDASASARPGGSEVVGDGLDGDCNGSETCYTDLDNDGSAISTLRASTDADCADSSEGTAAELAPPNGPDCNDSVSTIRPTATEVIGDNVDQNCDGTEVCYTDADNDNFSASSAATLVSADTDCADSGEGLSSEPRTDCDDTLARVYPGALEMCDNLRNSCSLSGWTNAMEDNKVSFVSPSGVWSDVSAQFSTGSFREWNASSAVPPQAGEFVFCPGSNYRTAITVSSVTGMTLRARDTSSPATIDARDNWTTLYVQDSRISVQGLTLTGGNAHGICTFLALTFNCGGGVVVERTTSGSGTDLTLNRVTLTNNYAEAGGGMALIGPAVVSMTDTVISANLADTYGGGVLLHGAGTVSATCTRESNYGIFDNTSGNLSSGGGVYFSNNTGSFSSSTCDWNSSTGVSNDPNDLDGSFSASCNYGLNASFTYTGATSSCPPSL